MNEREPAQYAQYLKLVRSHLSEFGLLLLQDPQFPNLAGLIAGEPIKGSWWGHPMGSAIYAVAEALDDDDVICSKLLSGKVTFVHKKLWSHLFTIGSAAQAWQTDKLSDEARQLLAMVNKAMTVATNEIEKSRTLPKPGKACDELEKNLLVYSHQIHTDSGKHARIVETWSHWRKRINLDASTLTVASAQDELEQLIKGMNQKFQAKAKLPWQ